MSFLQPLIALAATLAASPAFQLIAKVAVSVGLQFVVNWLRPDPPKPAGGVSLSLEFGAGKPRRVLFGRCVTAGRLEHAQNFGEGNAYVQKVVALSDYPVHSFGRVAMGGEWVVLGDEDESVSVNGIGLVKVGRRVKTTEHANYVWVRFHDGRQTTADAGVVAAASDASEWDANAVGTGVAYVVLTQKYDLDAHYQSPNALFEVYGARLYDWRKDSTVGGVGSQRWSDASTHAYSDNPAVIEYNYRRGLSVNGDPFCGMHMESSDLPLDKYTEAANICDEDVSNQARFTASVIASSDETHRTFVETLSMATGAMNVDGPDGSWPIIGSAREIVASLTEAEDMVEGSTPIYRSKRSMSELVNSISGTYSEPSNLFAPADFDPQESAILLATDRRTRDVSMNFPMVTSKRQANELASSYLSENRFEKTITGLMVRPRWRCLEVGDWIDYTSEDWGTATYVVKNMEIMAVESDGPRNVVLDLEERDSAIYESDGIVTPVTTLPDGAVTQYLSEPQTLTVTVTTVLGNNGKVIPAIFVSWSAITDPTVKGVEIQYRTLNDPSVVFSKYVEVSQSITYLTEAIVEQTEYEVRAKLVTTGRAVVASAWHLVLTPETPSDGLLEALEEVKETLVEPIIATRADVDSLSDEIRRLAATVGTLSGLQVQKTLDMSQEVETAKASISSEAIVRTTADDALAATISVVEAAVGATNARIETEEIARAEADSALALLVEEVIAETDTTLAGGLMALEASVSADKTYAQITTKVRIEEDGDQIDAGHLIVVEKAANGTLSSRYLIKAEEFILTGGGGTEYLPFVVQDGALKLSEAQIGNITSGLIQSQNGAVTFDLDAGLLTFDDGT